MPVLAPTRTPPRTPTSELLKDSPVRNGIVRWKGTRGARPGRALSVEEQVEKDTESVAAFLSLFSPVSASKKNGTSDASDTTGDTETYVDP